jgi:hypothetical protein
MRCGPSKMDNKFALSKMDEKKVDGPEQHQYRHSLGLVTIRRS